MIDQRIFGVVRLLATAACLLLCISAAAAAQEPIVTVVHTFTGSAGEGAHPNAALVEARDGSFYGVTERGGSANLGAIFRMTPGGTVTTLHSFTDGLGGLNNYPSLIQARDGNLYGVAPAGGGNPGQGTIFRMTPEGTFTVLHTFTGTPDGATPLSELLEASDGYLYGTTRDGGDEDVGTIFKISLDGTLTIVHSFVATGDAFSPLKGLVQGADGNFYGTTSRGAARFFRMTADGTVTGLQSIPRSFADAESGLVQGIDGNFYVTIFDGFRDWQGSGINGFSRIFRITPSGVVTVMAAFGGPPTNYAVAGTRTLLQASDRYLYGVANGSCVIEFPVDPRCVATYYFRMDLDGHVEFPKRFENGSNTTGAMYTLIEARDGNLYGPWRGKPETGSGPFGAVVRISNYTDCNDKLTVRYEEGTLHIGFTLMTKTPATWSTWLAVPGPPVQVGQLWSAPIAAVEPAVFTNLSLPAFPHIGKLFVLTALSTEGGAVCTDWKMVDTGAAAAVE